MQRINITKKEHSVVCKESAILTFRKARRNLLLLACSCLLLASACQKQVPATDQTNSQKNAPKEKLDWVVKRLEHAFELGQPSLVSGVHVVHTMSCQFRDAVAPETECQATVTIRTKTENVLPPPKDGEEARDARSNESEISSDYLPVGDLSKDPTREIKQQRVLLENQRIEDQQSFELVYRGEKWQLTKELQSDPERLWFQYALQP